MRRFHFLTFDWRFSYERELGIQENLCLYRQKLEENLHGPPKLKKSIICHQNETLTDEKKIRNHK